MAQDGDGQEVQAADVMLMAAQETVHRGHNLVAAVRVFREACVRGALAEAGGNRRQAAKRLGIQRTNIQYLIRKYGIDVPVPVRPVAPHGVLNERRRLYARVRSVRRDRARFAARFKHGPEDLAVFDREVEKLYAEIRALGGRPRGNGAGA